MICQQSSLRQHQNQQHGKASSAKNKPILGVKEIEGLGRHEGHFVRTLGPLGGGVPTAHRWLAQAVSLRFNVSRGDTKSCKVSQQPAGLPPVTR